MRGFDEKGELIYEEIVSGSYKGAPIDHHFKLPDHLVQQGKRIHVLNVTFADTEFKGQQRGFSYGIRSVTTQKSDAIEEPQIGIGNLGNFLGYIDTLHFMGPDYSLLVGDENTSPFDEWAYNRRILRRLDDAVGAVNPDNGVNLSISEVSEILHDFASIDRLRLRGDAIAKSGEDPLGTLHQAILDLDDFDEG